MVTIVSHTTRAAGTILTAAIYNADHINHITNATELNNSKLEGGTPPVVDGHAVVWDGTAANAFKTAGYPPFRDFTVGNGLLRTGTLPDRILNVDYATQAEAEAGSNAVKLMTPQRTLQCINFNVPLPVGAAFPFLGGTVPTKYVAANGGAISRTTYAALFAVIGTTYGAGNGSTTFNVPNGSRLMARFDSGGSIVPSFASRGATTGAATHTLTAANIQHTQPVSIPSTEIAYSPGANVSNPGGVTGTAGSVTMSSPTAVNHLPPMVATEYIIFANA